MQSSPIINQAVHALTHGKRVHLNYGGEDRVVEVHAIGTSRRGEEMMRVWQVRGGSESHDHAGWKLLKLDDTMYLHEIDEPSKAPRRGYRQTDPIFREVIAQI